MFNRIFFPIFERMFGTIFVADLAEGISFFIVFVLSVITLAKFINGDFHIFFSNLFSKKNNLENQNNISEKYSDIEDENDSSNYSSAGHKQAKAEEELTEAQEVIENYLSNEKEDENIICMCSCDSCIEGICGKCGKDECPGNEEDDEKTALYDEEDYEEPPF